MDYLHSNLSHLIHDTELLTADQQQFLLGEMRSLEIKFGEINQHHLLQFKQLAEGKYLEVQPFSKGSKKPYTPLKKLRMAKIIAIEDFEKEK